MNLIAAVYNFAVSLRDAAGTGDALESAIIHADTHEPMNEPAGTKYIRIDDLVGSVPQPVAPGVFKEFNAVLDVQFLQVPADPTLEERLAAAETVNGMALKFIESIYGDQRLGTGNCNVVDDCSVQKFNGWRKVLDIKTPISIVRLTMNKK